MACRQESRDSFEESDLPQRSAFLDDLRQGLGVRTLADLRDLPVADGWWEVIAQAYTKLSHSPPEPPLRAAHELRPVIATSAISRLDEAEIAARSLLLAPSVAVLLPDSINYPRRLLRLATLLEPAIDE